MAADALQYLGVIDRILAMNYLKPDLRRKVLRLQRDLIRIEADNRFAWEDPADSSA